MSYQHAKEDPIADAEVVRLHAEEDNDVVEPRLLQLFLDTDALYRWYEEDASSEVSSGSLLGAFEQAEAAWESFQLVELRGDPVTPDFQVEEAYAADELAEYEEATDEE